MDTYSSLLLDAANLIDQARDELEVIPVAYGRKHLPRERVGEARELVELSNRLHKLHTMRAKRTVSNDL